MIQNIPTIKKHSLYNGTVELIFNTKGHRYTVNGESKVGVTSILSIINKPALIQWAVNEGVSYIKENLKAGTTYDEIELHNILENAKKAHRVRKTEAADFGTLAHSWIEKYIKGENPEPLVNKTLQNAINVFLKWVDEKNVKFIASEQPIYSKKYDYCGTYDFLCEIDGKRYIGDLKTSKGIYGEYHMQLAAYRYAVEEETQTPVDGCLIVRIPKTEDDHVEIAHMNNYNANAKAFLYAVGLYKTKTHLDNLLKKGDEK